MLNTRKAPSILPYINKLLQNFFTKGPCPIFATLKFFFLPENMGKANAEVALPTMLLGPRSGWPFSQFDFGLFFNRSF